MLDREARHYFLSASRVRRPPESVRTVAGREGGSGNGGAMEGSERGESVVHTDGGEGREREKNRSPEALKP